MTEVATYFLETAHGVYVECPHCCAMLHYFGKRAELDWEESCLICMRSFLTKEEDPE